MTLRALSLLLICLALCAGASAARAQNIEDAGDDGDAKAKAVQHDPPVAALPKGPKKIKIGAWVENVGKLDLATGAFQAEIYVSMSCAAGTSGDCTTGIDFANGKSSGKVEVIDEGPNPKVVKVKADLNADIDLSEYPSINRYSDTDTEHGRRHGRSGLRVRLA